MKLRQVWNYLGVNVFPVGMNNSGIRWTANMGIGITLRADTKEEMRHLIKHYKSYPPD